MPEMFGTHHSKMLILIRRDDTAQVVIHTANMIPFDWENMTQAIWRSPLLPKFCGNASSEDSATKIGSGQRFKLDLLNYLKAYDTRRIVCKPLIEELFKYDFSQVRGALVASVPGRQGVEIEPRATSWGWPGLKNVLNLVPVQDEVAEIVLQISSIASLGPTDKWLNMFLKALCSSNSVKVGKIKPRIVFPTAEEIRRSLNGYSSGSAIHTKIQSDAQLKQLKYLKPLLCHWAGDVKEHRDCT
jgi:tyrosyl-DNA phosphodiesterase 1